MGSTAPAINADEAVARIRAAVAQGNVDVIKKELVAAGSTKTNQKLPKRVNVTLIWCKGCQDGRMLIELATGDGKSLQVVKLSEDPVPVSFIGRLVEQSTTPEDNAGSTEPPTAGE